MKRRGNLVDYRVMLLSVFTVVRNMGLEVSFQLSVPQLPICEMGTIKSHVRGTQGGLNAIMNKKILG